VRFAGEFHTGEDCATGIRSYGAIGDRGSIDAIGNAILLGVGARNRPLLAGRDTKMLAAKLTLGIANKFQR
jgi:hypothetical protein